jgi:hypothetical protein
MPSQPGESQIATERELGVRRIEVWTMQSCKPCWVKAPIIAKYSDLIQVNVIKYSRELYETESALFQ